MILKNKINLTGIPGTHGYTFAPPPKKKKICSVSRKMAYSMEKKLLVYTSTVHERVKNSYLYQIAHNPLKSQIRCSSYKSMDAIHT